MPFSTLEERFSTLEASNRELAAVVVGLTESLNVLGAIQREQEAQNRAIRKTEERDAHTRRLGMYAAAATLVIASLASVVIYALVLSHVNALLERQQHERYAGCMARNVAATENIDREKLLAQASPDPVERKIHAESSERLKRGIVDCEKYRP